MYATASGPLAVEQVKKLGLDENTVAIIAPDGTLDILGDNKVTVIDGWKIEAGLPQAETIMTLNDGDRYDLKKRIVISP